MQRESPRISAAAASSLLILHTGEAAGGWGAISAAALPNGRTPGNATRSARHLGSNIVQSVSEVVESVGLFVCRETLLHWRLTGCGKCNMRLHPDYERVAVGVTRVRGSGENSCN